MGRKYEYTIGEKSSLLTLYVTKYMNKAGKCELSDSILDSKNNKNKSLASYLWNIALRFTNNRECEALEAADTLLGIPLYEASRQLCTLLHGVQRRVAIRAIRGHLPRDGDGSGGTAPARALGAHAPASIQRDG